MTARRMMWEWRVKLNIPDYLTGDQEEALLEAVSDVIDYDQIYQFVVEKLKDYDLVYVEVLE